MEIATADQMVIGVELEMLFWRDTKPKGSRPRTSSESQWLREEAFVQELLTVLAEGGVRAYIEARSHNSIDIEREKALRPHLWKISNDISIQPEETDKRMWSKDLCWMAAEISSPPLPLTERSLKQIAKVAQILADMGAETPSSTGFHVHISVRQGYTFKHIKGIVSSAIAYKQLRQFHSMERVLSEYCICPSVQFSNQHPAEIAAEIEDCLSIRDLMDLMHVPLSVRLNPHHDQIGFSRVRFTAINYMNLLNKRKTIEFRSHRGTVNAKEIERWILTCAAIVDIGGMSSKVFQRVAKKICNDHTNHGREYTAMHMLRDLGKPNIAALWANNLHLHSWSEDDVFRPLESHLQGMEEILADLDSDTDKLLDSDVDGDSMSE